MGALVLTVNVCTSEMCGPGAGCAAALSGGSSAPMAPPVSNAEKAERPGDMDFSRLDQYPSDRYEIHGVVSPADCRRMAERFRNERRRVRLTRSMPNPSKGVLQYLCIFEGEDVNNDIFQDNRYNSTKEFDSP